METRELLQQVSSCSEIREEGYLRGKGWCRPPTFPPFWHLDGLREETLKKDFRDPLNWGVKRDSCRWALSRVSLRPSKFGRARTHPSETDLKGFHDSTQFKNKPGSSFQIERKKERKGNKGPINKATPAHTSSTAPFKPPENNKWAFIFGLKYRERNGESQEPTCLNLSWGNASGPIFFLISGNQKQRFFEGTWRRDESVPFTVTEQHCQFFHFQTTVLSYHSFVLYLITILSKLMALLGRRTRKHYTHAPADFLTFTSKRTLSEINAAILISK